MQLPYILTPCMMFFISPICDSFPGMSENSSFASSCPPYACLLVHKEINYSFIHSFKSLMNNVPAQGGSGDNTCYRSTVGRPGWFPGPDPLYAHAFPACAMVQVSKLWVIGGNTASKILSKPCRLLRSYVSATILYCTSCVTK